MNQIIFDAMRHYGFVICHAQYLRRSENERYKFFYYFFHELVIALLLVLWPLIFQWRILELHYFFKLFKQRELK